MRQADARKTAPIRGATLNGVDVWIFDLDNTLYPPETNLFAQIHARMGTFIAQLLDVNEEAAWAKRRAYFHKYGTTLRGLMHEHNIAPYAFLDYVHDIDYSVVGDDPRLRAAIRALSGRKYIFTNGTRAHANAVLSQAGLTGLFDRIFDVADAGFLPKPGAKAYAAFLSTCDVRPDKAAFFEDLSVNLKVPHALGMKTVLVGDARTNDRARKPGKLDTHVHYFTRDLSDFLRAVAGGENGHGI